VLRVPTQPLYARFRGGYREATLYRAGDARMTAPSMADGIDPMALRGRLMEADGRWTDFAAGALAGARAALAPGAAVQGATSLALAPPNAMPLPAAAEEPGDIVKKTGALALVNYRICTRWLVQYIDSAQAEDVYATTSWQYVPAAFASAYVVIFGGSHPSWQGKLDVNGCTPTVGLSPGASYALGQSSADMGWSGGPIMDNFLITNGARVAQWVRTSFTTPAAAGTVTLQPTYNDDVVQVNAISAAALVKEALTDQGLLNGQRYTVDVNATECTGADSLSCPKTMPLTGVIKVGTNTVNNATWAHWKFVIAHELGHAAQFVGMGFHAYEYTWTGAPELCRCSHVSDVYGSGHCIQSRSNITGAQLEGFAHAFAARVFNNDSETTARFIYYKPYLQPGLQPVVLNPPRWFNPQTNTKFMATYCSAAGKGTELDWMQFYYQLTAGATLNKTPMSNLFSIWKRACSGNINTKCKITDSVSWTTLQNAAQAYWGAGSPLYNRFRDTGINAGVNF
jgi:hypothetical protein